MRTVFREGSPRKTASFEEQIMSKGKYPNMFTRQMELAVVYIQYLPAYKNLYLRTC